LFQAAAPGAHCLRRRSRLLQYTTRSVLHHWPAARFILSRRMKRSS
jgi:hypothetical protein